MRIADLMEMLWSGKLKQFMKNCWMPKYIKVYFSTWILHQSTNL